MKNPNNETVAQYLKRKGVKVLQNWTAKDVFEAYCKERELEACK